MIILLMAVVLTAGSLKTDKGRTVIRWYALYDLKYKIASLAHLFLYLACGLSRFIEGAPDGGVLLECDEYVVVVL